MPGELFQIYAHKTAINDSRAVIKGNGFDMDDTDFYWSSREYSNECEYRVNLNRGDILGNNINKDDEYSILSFLALEVPQES